GPLRSRRRAPAPPVAGPVCATPCRIPGPPVFSWGRWKERGSRIKRKASGGKGADEHLLGQLAEGMDAAGFQVVEDDLSRAEEVRVDGVEVVLVALEDCG